MASSEERSDDDDTVSIRMRRLDAAAVAFLAVVLLPRIACAHETGDVAGGFLSGVTHPVFGLDHLVAMIAVGLWGAQLKEPAIWVLPVTFPLVMAVGGALGIRQVSLPFVEIGIAVSAIVLGVMVAGSVRPPFWVAATLVGGFALFHGHAHGSELPQSATPLAYGAGFVISTGLLHAVGIAIGVLTRWKTGERLVRLCGGTVACVGFYFLVSSVSGL